MTPVALTRAQVVEKAARAILKYEVWHARVLAESKKRKGREKYEVRGQTTYQGRTAWDILEEFAGDDQVLFHELASEAQARARELREL